MSRLPPVSRLCRLDFGFTCFEYGEYFVRVVDPELPPANARVEKTNKRSADGKRMRGGIRDTMTERDDKPSRVCPQIFRQGTLKIYSFKPVAFPCIVV